MTSRGLWRWAAASVASHKKERTDCQDAFAVARLDYNSSMRAANRFARECVGAIVSDGAGSARYGQDGARISCLLLLNYISRDVDRWMTHEGLRKGSQRIPREHKIRKWIKNTRNVMEEIAKRNQTITREFASTIAGIVITPDGISAWQIGDCTVVGRRKNSWEVVCWPEEGEYESATYFLTDEPEIKFHYFAKENEYDAFALFTDGLKNLVLDSKNKVASQNFFSPMIQPVDDSRRSGELGSLSKQLGGFLRSKRVCERTDDDKTLVLLSRR